jgi:hypothetical protein
MLQVGLSASITVGTSQSGGNYYVQGQHQTMSQQQQQQQQLQQQQVLSPDMVRVLLHLRFHVKPHANSVQARLKCCHIPDVLPSLP